MKHNCHTLAAFSISESLNNHLKISGTLVYFDIQYTIPLFSIEQVSYEQVSMHKFIEQICCPLYATSLTT